MKLLLHRRQTEGSALLTVIMISGILVFVLTSMMQLSSTSVRRAYERTSWNSAFFHAENALQWAAQRIAEAPEGDVTLLGNFSASSGSLNLPYVLQAVNNAASGLKNVWVTVDRTGITVPNLYRVTSSAQLGGKVRTVQAMILKNPASQVFDYDYFLNNWGWWWGTPITGQGSSRANWDFDFRSDPTVNGSIMANGSITENGTIVDPFSGNPPFTGLAGNDPLAYVHSGVARLSMPNLKDLTYYQQKATAANGTLYQGTTLLVSAVHNNASQPGLYLEGTAAAPIQINGPVVIPGDVVIKGKITGKGTLYVGGNLYIAGDVTYVNAPNWTTPPEPLPASQRDQWVDNNKTRDLIGFAVRESIFAGNVNDTAWKSACYDASVYGLKYVGNESQLGADGIADTGDDGISYDHDGDGSLDGASFDADGDGVTDSALNYDTQIKMTTTRASKINRYPTSSGAPVDYSTKASNDMNLLDGIFYTNHAAAMRLAKSDSQLRGLIASRDEAIIFNNTLKFIYDSRVHSRYNKDPNRFVDLGLPVAGLIRQENFTELAPVAGFYSGGSL
jgi:Tfp pilus assembly protein PilX